MNPVAITEPRLLSELIELAANELKKSNLTAAVELHRMFSYLAGNNLDKTFDTSVCWVRGPKNPNDVNDRYVIPASQIAQYMNNCMFQRTVECVMPDGSKESVKDEFVVFSPALLMDELEKVGYAWVAGKGVFGVDELPATVSLPTQSLGFSMPYETKELKAMKAAADKFWTDYDRSRPPLQKTVSAFIADGLGVSAANRKTDALAAAIRPGDAPHER